MPDESTPLRRLGFLTIGLFDGDDPGPGHESTLAIIELGEQLGFDSAWLRHRHLQYGISSPVAVLAAATQRTRRIELGTAVTPLGWENPLRLAEDLATVDVLSGGRLNPGISVGPPMRYDDVKEALYPDTADVEDFSYAPGRAAAARRPRRAGHRLPRDGGHRGVLRPGAAALARARVPRLVRRRQPALGAVGRRARTQPPHQQRRQGRGVGGLRRRCSSRRSAPFREHHPYGYRGPGVPGARGDPDRLRVGRAAGDVRGVRGGAARRGRASRRGRRG